MKNKVSILVATAILTIVVFSISTAMQKRLINYEAKVNCLMATVDIFENESVSSEMFKVVEVPISLVVNNAIISDFSEVENLYAKTQIYKGQLVFKKHLDTQENLSIFENNNGQEMISVKIESPENGVSYSIKKNSYINLYVTLKNNYATDFLLENERLQIGDEYEGYTVIKLIDEVKVLGVFNIDGYEITNAHDGIIDSIMISVDADVAKQISLLRDIGSFNVTGVTVEKPILEDSGEIVESGEMAENYDVGDAR